MKATIAPLTAWEIESLEYAMRALAGGCVTEQDPERSTAWSGLRTLYDRAAREADEPRLYVGPNGVRFGKFGKYLYVNWNCWRSRPGHRGWQRRLNVRVGGHGFDVGLRKHERLPL